MRRRHAIACLVLLAGVAAAGVLLDRCFPPDLSRFADTSTVMLDRDGTILRAYTSRDGMWRLPTRPKDVEPRYIAMLKGYEDRRFDEHPGVDPLALLRALWQLASHGHVVSGGSTLTMQAARLLQPHAHDLPGKMLDILRALQLEAHYTKQQILSFYLTLAPFGGNLEGVRAASLAYFGKEPRHLTDAESALLVALPQSPTRRRPEIDRAAARTARDYVLERLVEAGVLTGRQAAEAAVDPVPRQRLALPFLAPHLADRLRPGTPPGQAIRTTIDGTMQATVEHLARHEAVRFADGATLAILVAENRGRWVRVYVGNADFAAPQGQVDLAQASRSPGSILKPFIYGIAFDDLLLHPDTLIDDRPMRFGTYAPQNFDRGFHGTVSVRYALQHSLNVPAVAVLNRIGPERLAAALRQAGATLVFPPGSDGPALPLALGGVGIDLADLVMLYAGIADGGEIKPLQLIQEDGNTPGVRLISRNAATYLTRILVGTPTPEGIVPQQVDRGRRWVAYKTGTSYGFRDAWAVGFSADYTVGVWVGRADGTPRPGSYGANTAAPVLFKVFDLLPQHGREPLPVLEGDAIRADASEALPVNLRRFVAQPQSAEARPPVIVYPPDGAVIDRTSSAAGGGRLALIAEGGEPPLNWIVNGRPVPAAPPGAPVAWHPDGDGFAQISVADRRGQTASVSIRLQSEWR